MKARKKGDFISNDTEKLDRERDLKASFSRRVLLIFLVFFLALCGLFYRLFLLQVRRYEHYRTRAQSNRVRIRPVVPERGKIYDRHGVLLTENILRYRLVVHPSQVERLSVLLDDLQGFIALSDEERQAFLERFKRTPRYQGVMLRESISEDIYYRLSVELHRFPGLAIEPYYERYYPYGALCAHILGYTNRISAEDLERIDVEAYRGLDFIGRAGIEAQYEVLLRGRVGLQKLEADVNGNMVRLLEEMPSVRGQDLYLSLDLALQRFIYDLLKDYRGACVAIEPQTGEVLAMVSTPSFDNNLFTRGISVRQYRALQDNPFAPLFDRALRGAYSPGSVIKPMLLLAGLYHQVVAERSVIFCSGSYRVNDNPRARAFHCWRRSGHGRMQAVSAVAQSCDVYFYSLGQSLGIDKIHDYCQYFSMGRLTGIDLPNEGSGILPSRQWKERVHKVRWYVGDTVNVSIGQGYFTTTPLQLAYMTTLIARQGMSFTPHFLKRVYNPERGSFEEGARSFSEARVPVYRAYDWQVAERSMLEVMKTGTGRNSAQGLSYEIAGKSGTVQVISFRGDQRIAPEDLAEEHQDNAMFVAYAPMKNPKIALSLVVERAGSGSAVAGPMVRKIMDFYLAAEERG